MKSAFVTGANRGLGKGFVRSLLKKDFLVFAGTKAADSSLKNEKKLIWVQADVTDDNSIQRAAAVVHKKVGILDLLINNAGINRVTGTSGKPELVDKLEYLDRNMLLHMLDVNAVGPIIVIKFFLPLLKAQPSFVINVSSCRASFHDEFERTNANYGYRASKIALNMLTWSSQYELPKSVKTFAVHPGDVKTDMNPGGLDDPEKQADKVLSIVENWKDEFNGKFLRYNGVYYPL